MTTREVWQYILIPLLSAFIGGAMALSGVLLTIWYNKNNSEKRQRIKDANSKKVLLLILRNTYKMCLENLKITSNIEWLRNRIIPKVDGNKTAQENPVIYNMLSVPFETSEKVIYLFESGIITEKEFEIYFNIKNEYASIISLKITFYDLFNKDNISNHPLGEEIIERERKIISNIENELDRLSNINVE